MDKQRKSDLLFIAILIASVLAFNFILHNFGLIPKTILKILSVFQPFVLGSAFAFIVNVVLKKVEKFLKNIFPTWKASSHRIISLIISLFFIIGIVFFVVFMVVPEFVKAITEIIKVAPKVINDITISLTDWFNGYPEIVKSIQNMQTTWQQLANGFLKDLTGSIGSILNNAVAFLTSTFSVLINVFIALAFSIYVLLSKEKLKRHFKKLIFALLNEKNANYVVDLCTLTNHTFSNFITGQVTEAFINGLLTFIGCIIFGFPYAPVIAVLVGFFAMIPYFGAMIGTAISLLLVASNSWTQGIIFLVYQIVIQQVDGNFIYPRIVGDQIGLPAIWVMVAVTTGATVAGFVGMVIFVPFTSIVYALLVMSINRRLEKKQINVEDIQPRILGDLFPKKDGTKDTHTI